VANGEGNRLGIQDWFSAGIRMFVLFIVVVPVPLSAWTLSSIVGLYEELAQTRLDKITSDSSLRLQIVNLQNQVLQNSRTLDDRKDRIRELENKVSILHDRAAR